MKIPDEFEGLPVGSIAKKSAAPDLMGQVDMSELDAFLASADL